MSVYLLISSGNGPLECRLAVAGVLRKIGTEAEALGVDCDGSSHGDMAPASAVLALHGPGATALARRWIGTVQWRNKSKLRQNHKRANWFVGVFELPAPAGDRALDVSEIRYETFRAGGAGGQHQNTTDSAVRAVWRGHSVVVRDQRSQHRNKAVAVERLQALIATEAALGVQAQGREQALLHRQLQRGNPVRIFVGDGFEEVTG